MASYKQKRDRYIDLKINGRLFPSYILANFKAYKLPEILKTDEDACFRKTKDELRKYQLFVSKYMDFNGPYKNLLIYHGLGSGKTSSAINIYNMLYNYTPGWNVYMLTKATLKNSTWLPELKKWLYEEEREYRMQNIVFVSYDAPNADKAFMEAIKNSDASKKSLYIVDEAHNFIRNVYSNISSKQGRRAQTIYEYMIQDQKENEGTRIVLLSATPAINSPYELALMFNLLRPGIFPKSESQFNQEFISSSSYRTISSSKKNVFQRRILGLVSYYIGATPDYYASKTTDYVDVKMSKYQEEIYTYFEEIEEKIARKKRSKTSSSETYKSYTRQACNFTFPFMDQGITGETRPRPRGFKISEKDAQLIEKAKENPKAEKGTDKYYNVQNYLDATIKFVDMFDSFLEEKHLKDVDLNHTLQDDLKIYHQKYNDDYVEFHEKEEKKSLVYTELHKCSAKFLHAIFNIMKSPGPVLVYSNYVLMEGLQIFKIYLKCFGFSSLETKESITSLTGNDFFRYAEYHGGIDQKQRAANLVLFNDKENKHAKICKIIMISPAGAEGLSLMNTRQVHLLEPYWHEVRMIQMIGRAVRLCSHKELPMSERHVDIYRYKSVRSSGGKQTTDQYIEDLARGKEGLIQSFLDAMKEAAIDCELNKTHNSLVQDFKCFQFDEPSLFDDQIGPAYKEDIHDDFRMDNGSNSIKSQVMRIKVIKIKAVKQLSPPNTDKDKIKYSKIDYYWYNQINGVVYDYLLHFPIGKIGYDDDDLPQKVDKDIYVIDKLVPIPHIEEEEE
jgi:superfamily II DNA or RNA helicase